MADHIGHTYLVARKPHNCCLCLLPIAVGERHLRGVTIQDGSAYTFRAHAGCVSYATGAIGETEWPEGDVLQHVRDRLVRTDYPGRNRWIDAEEAAKLRAEWPGIAGVVDYVAAEMARG